MFAAQETRRTCLKIKKEIMPNDISGESRKKKQLRDFFVETDLN